MGSTASGKPGSSHSPGCRTQKRLMLTAGSTANSLKSETKGDIPASKNKCQNPSGIPLKSPYFKKTGDVLLTSNLNGAKLLYYHKSELLMSLGGHILINFTMK